VAADDGRIERRQGKPVGGLEAMDLRYGSFDFAVTSNDDYVFLECNSGGQFGWIEANTGLPITHALADLLERQQ
jgi:hypothetical protein